MEITKEQIIEALTAKPELAADLIPTISTNEAFTKLINNKADAIYNEKIGEEVKKIYGNIDNDIFEITGERPGTNQDGTKQKTFEKIKEIATSYKKLNDIKDTLTKDEEVKRLNAQIEDLKKNGGAQHVQEVFDQAKAQWKQKETDLLEQLKNANSSATDFKKSTAIRAAIQQIKFNPDTPESIKKMVLATAEKQLLQNSKFENDNLVFLTPEGKAAVNEKYENKTALEMLASMDEIKAISLNDNKNKGGNAKPTITGSIQVTNVEGKDEKKLILTPGSFKTKTEFIDAAEKALLDSGVTMEDPEWDKLKNAAYLEHKVSELPN